MALITNQASSRRAARVGSQTLEILVRQTNLPNIDWGVELDRCKISQQRILLLPQAS